MQIDIDRLLNLPDTAVLGIEFTESKVFLTLRRVTKEEICPVCHKACQGVRSYTHRTVRDLPILGRKTYLQIEVRQFECRDCSRYFTESIDFVEGNHGLTKRYESYLYMMVKGLNIQQISLKEDVCWATVNAVHRAYANAELKAREVNWAAVKRISIDEIAVRKGKKNYACVLRDPDADVILDFLEKRDMATLIAYFTAKGAAFCAQIEEIISDMWDGYVNLAGENGIFKQAKNVIDVFHFVQHLGKALDGERKAVRKAFPEETAFKNLRWAVLKSPVNLTEEDKTKLKLAFELSPNLAKIYQLRIDMKVIFDTDCTKEVGLAAINKWAVEASTIESKPLATFLITVGNWKEKVANFFTDRVTNAGMEGTNNHIRSIIRRSFGYVDFQSLRRRVLTECGEAP
jgi:transposase